MTMTPNERPSPSPGQSTNPLQPVLFEVKRTIVGQDVLLERMAIALLSGGHLLVEGVPGLAKTLSVKSLAAPDGKDAFAGIGFAVPIGAALGGGRGNGPGQGPQI